MVAREHSCLVEENSLWIPTGLYTIDSESGSQKLLGSPEPGIQSGASDGDPEESRGTLLQQGRGPVQGQAFCSRDRWPAPPGRQPARPRTRSLRAISAG